MTYHLDIFSKEYIENPLSFYRVLRSNNPICRVAPHGFWALSRHSDIKSVLSKPSLFSSSVMDGSDYFDPKLRPFFSATSLLGMDPPEHTNLRNLLTGWFSPGNLNLLRQQMDEYCTKLLSRLPEQSIIDVSSHFSDKLPIAVICNILGISDVSAHEQFARWSKAVLKAGEVSMKPSSDYKNIEIEETYSLLKDFRSYLGELIANRSRSPDFCLISKLSTAIKSRQISESQLISIIRLLIVAGNDSTKGFMNHCFYRLASDESLFKAIKSNIGLLDRFLSEVLRYHPSVVGLLRLVKKESYFYGKLLRPGETILLLIQSANHDEEVFDRPEEFNIYRNDSRSNLSFGHGIHTCLGKYLAMMEVKSFFLNFLKKVSKIRFSGEDPTIFNSLLVRGYSRMPLYIEMNGKLK